MSKSKKCEKYGARAVLNAPIIVYGGTEQI